MPSTAPIVYRVEPSGYADMIHSNKDLWCLFIVQERNATEWVVRLGGITSPTMLTREGDLVFDDAPFRRRRRFSLKRALELAEAHVDTLKPRGHTAQEASDFARTRIQQRSA